MLSQFLKHPGPVPIAFLAALTRGISELPSDPSRSLTTMESRGVMQSAKKPAYGWCCVAGAASDSTEIIQIDKITGYGDQDLSFQQVNGKHFDITVSSDWMEFIERSENRMNDDGGAGAYDTLRSDLILQTDSSNDRWRIWGEDYHLDRLQRSFSSLVTSDHVDDNLPSDISVGTNEAIEEAVKESRTIFRTLLSEAESSKTLHKHIDKKAPWEDVLVQLIKFTWLWSPSHDGERRKIIVRGHACSSAKPMQIHQAVKPIVVTVAAARGRINSTHPAEVDESMPTRYNDPQNKIASWIRERKKMENPETYMPPGVSEVLMVRSAGLDLELLEGISSNVFAIYKDNTLRTAQDGVLFGYVRHLVLQCAETCGLTVDPRPILLKDAEEGLWKEAFITSSSRLIFPISKVLMHTADDSEFAEYWRDPVLTGAGPKAAKPKWRELLDEILRRGGYPRVC